MHILAASLVMLTISSVLSAPIRNNSIKVEDQYGSQDENGFVWGYNLSDGRKVVQNGVIREQTDGTKILVFDGSYSFIGSDGVEYIVEYYADETGYHPTVIVNKKETTTKKTFGIDKEDYTPFPSTTTRPPQATYNPESSIDPKVLASLIG
ncbi:larval cuticle protein 16/17-like [Culex pipiens pallens]|uniref:larval cuticle protein 16/17-like n=1 Tax=Culex pipiens pallens TaxID=42434 RepID=UPI0022AA86C5|nr:larval cuticle protein 16/17-like [Culex pipiens pallens]